MRGFSSRARASSSPAGVDDVIPLAVMAQTIEAAGLDGAPPQRMQGESPCRRIGEEARMQDLDAGIDEGRHLARIAEGDPAELIHGEIPGALIAHGAHRGMQQQKPVHPRIVPDLGEAIERLAAPAAPDDLGIDDIEGLGPQQRQGLGDAAAAVEDLGLMGNRDRGMLAAREMALDLRGEVMGVHHRPLDADLRQPVQGMIEQRLARHLHQRLGPLQAERAEPRGKPGGQHHGGLRNDGAGNGHAASGVRRRSGGR